MDPITFIEDAFKDTARGVEGVKAVKGPEELPVTSREYPACLVAAGNITPTSLGREEGGDCLIEMEVQIDVMLVLDTEAETFRTLSRTLLFRVLGAFADPTALGLSEAIEELSLKGIQVQAYESEKGSQGGFHLAFTVLFTVRETSPGVIEPRQ